MPQTSEKQGKLFSLLLILSCLLFILIIPVIDPENKYYGFTISFIMIFVAALMAVGVSRTMIVAILLTLAMQFISAVFQLTILNIAAFATSICYFTLVVAKLVILIASRKKVTSLILLDAISVYLLIGIVFFLFNLILTAVIPDSISGMSEEIHPSEVLYYTFVTFTTLGYGDMSPLHPVGRSLSVATAVSGQIYLTIVIALIVGKYLAQTPDVNSPE